MKIKIFASSKPEQIENDFNNWMKRHEDNIDIKKIKFNHVGPALGTGWVGGSVGTAVMILYKPKVKRKRKAAKNTDTGPIV